MWMMAMAALGCIATGERPAWRLCGSRTDLTLQIDGEAPVRLGTASWRDTPRGRELTARAPDGPVSLVTVFGRCRSGGRWERSVDQSNFVVLTLPGGRVLRGCMTGGGAVYPG